MASNPPAGSPEERRELLARHQEALLELTRLEGQCQSLDEALRLCTETAARTLGVRRAGVWVFDDERSKITCLCLYDLDASEHASGVELFARDYPTYFAALEENRALAADDARSDPRTVELAAPYLDRHGITSMLDAPVRKEGRVVGVVCHEHIGRRRVWSLEEQHFAGSIADIVALAVEHFGRVRAERELRERDVMLDGVARTANRMFAEAEDELRHRDALLDALAEAATCLLTDDADRCAESALGAIGAAARLDRVSVFEDRDDAATGDTVMSEQFAWRRGGSGAPLERATSYGQLGLLRWATSFALGRPVSGSAASFPAHERPYLERRGIGAVVAVPVLVRDRLWGHLEFGAEDAGREWTSAEERYFRAAAALVGCALAARE